MNENQEYGVGGGSGGGEPIGLAQEALGGGAGGGGSDGGGGSGGGRGCCCPATLAEGTPVKCHDANDPSECGQYEHYSDGACNPPPTKPTPLCAISSAVGVVDHGVIANVEGFGLFFVLALCAAMRRRTR
jgi:hypothetical protein